MTYRAERVHLSELQKTNNRKAMALQMKFDIDSLTVADLRDIRALLGDTPRKPKASKSHSMTVGTAVLIRTVTLYYTGIIESITVSDIVLTDAAWIADTGRYAEAIKTGKLSEIEPFPGKVIVCRGGIIDIAPWSHPLPKDQK